MVPEDWKVEPLSKLLEKIIDYRGQSVPKAKSGIPLITARNVRAGFIDFSAKEYVSEEAFDAWMSRGIPSKGDILFTTEAPLGNACRFPETGRYAVGQRTVSLRPNEKLLNAEYLLYFLLSERGQRLIDLRSSGSTAKGIKSSELKKVKITLPSELPEQKKIAQILSTWDQAITATERLLENSQQRKKGLMQQLLTGKKRLPGFEGEWKKIELGAALDYQQPTPFLVKSTEYSDDFPTPVLTAGKSFLLGYTDETFGIYDEGLPVIIFDDFTTASQFVDFPFKAKSSAMKILTAKPGYSIRFIFEAMKMIRFAVGGHQRHWISIFANLVIPCPSSEEQQAISEVFATADREIASLQARLGSLKSEKKALMQQLLTGKRRVQVEAA